MKYSLWHCGVLMGDAHMRKNPTAPRQIMGQFRPTAYGRTLLPPLTGLLSAAAALKREMSVHGISEEALPEATALAQFLENSPAGQRMADVGRIIADLELRDPSGAPVAFETIGFLDTAALQSLARELGRRTADPSRRASPDLASVILVSATLAPQKSATLSTRRIEIT
jgi:hypothetical protein